MSGGARERKQISLEIQDPSPLTENKREKIFGNSLTDPQNYGIINTKKGKENLLQTRKDTSMKKQSMETLVAFIDAHNLEELFPIKDELTAELAKDKAQKDANQALYAEIHDAVMTALKSATAPVTAQELADETGYPKGKIVYGLTRYWVAEVEKTEGKVNTYALKA